MNAQNWSERTLLRPVFSSLKIVFIFVIVFITTFSLVIMPRPASAVDTLGLRIDVLPNSTSSEEEPYAQSRRLWFVKSVADPVTRRVRITSSVPNAQKVSLQITAAKKIDGVISPNFEAVSELKPWATFSEESFVLKQFESKEIVITIDPPSDLTNYSQDAFFIVKTGALSAPVASKTETTAILESKFQYATPLFFGIGEQKNLLSMEIKDVNTYLDENGKFAEVIIKNNGFTPIDPNGDAQFTNLDFQTASIGPLTFSLTSIAPGEEGIGTIRLPEQMIAGKWKVFIQAYVGSYGEAVLITKDLSFEFKKSSPLPGILLFIGSILLLVALLKFQRRLRVKEKLPKLAKDDGLTDSEI